MLVVTNGTHTCKNTKFQENLLKNKKNNDCARILHALTRLYSPHGQQQTPNNAFRFGVTSHDEIFLIDCNNKIYYKKLEKN